MVTLLSKDGCVQCTATKRKLDQLGVDYKERNMSHDAEALSLAKELGHLQAPIVIPRDGQSWSGYDPGRLERLVE